MKLQFPEYFVVNLNMNLIYLDSMYYFHFTLDNITIFIWLFNSLLHKQYLEFYVCNVAVRIFLISKDIKAMS
jgi:hypothetical protein